MTTAEGREALFLQGGGRTVVLQTRRNPDGTESHAEYRPWLQRFTSADGTTTEVAMQAAAGGRFQRTVQVPGRVTVKTPSGLASSSSFSRSTTTTAGEPLAVLGEVGEARVNAKVWRSEYLADAGTVTVTTPEGRVASMTLDAKRRPLVVTSPGVLPVTSEYDSRGRLVSMTQGQRSVTLAWGAEGYLASTRNALGEVTALTTDATGRLLKVTRADLKDVGLESDPVTPGRHLDWATLHQRTWGTDVLRCRMWWPSLHQEPPLHPGAGRSPPHRAGRRAPLPPAAAGHRAATAPSRRVKDTLGTRGPRRHASGVRRATTTGRPHQKSARLSLLWPASLSTLPTSPSGLGSRSPGLFFFTAVSALRLAVRLKGIVGRGVDKRSNRL